MKKHYEIGTDWEGNLYCGIKLDWNYEQGHLNISMPGYIQHLLEKCQHKKPTKPQYSPYQAAPQIYGVGADKPIPDDATKKVDEKRSKRV